MEWEGIASDLMIYFFVSVGHSITITCFLLIFTSTNIQWHSLPNYFHLIWKLTFSQLPLLGLGTFKPLPFEAIKVLILKMSELFLLLGFPTKGTTNCFWRLNSLRCVTTVTNDLLFPEQHKLTKYCQCVIDYCFLLVLLLFIHISRSFCILFSAYASCVGYVWLYFLSF